jgi:hypothetical protein
MFILIQYIQSIYFLILQILLDFEKSVHEILFHIEDEIETDDEEELDQDTKYINKYGAKFEEIVENRESKQYNSNVETLFYDKKEFTEYMRNENNEIEKIWKTRILMENYSRGNIIMFYDAYKLGFSYYCDQNVVSYDILNAIAMKYAITYQCLPFFIDEMVLPEDYKVDLKIHYVEDKKEKRSVDVNHTFAKLRNYSNVSTTTTQNKNEKNENKKKTEDKLRNKFIYLGNIRNFKMCQTPIKKHTMNHFSSSLLDGLAKDNKTQRECINYAEFKKKFEALKI